LKERGRKRACQQEKSSHEPYLLQVMGTWDARPKDEQMPPNKTSTNMPSREQIQ